MLGTLSVLWLVQVVACLLVLCKVYQGTPLHFLSYGSDAHITKLSTNVHDLHNSQHCNTGRPHWGAEPSL